MTSPAPLLSQEQLFATLEATWPPAARQHLNGWTIRDGQEGGKRVSAATAEADWRDEAIPEAEAAMRALGQAPLFLIREQDVLLDQALQSRGYRIIDPVVAYAIPAAQLADPPAPLMSTFPHWHPLQICRDLWAEGGIGPARVAVMERVIGPKSAILSRHDDKPSGVAFVAQHEKIAMVHAVEVSQRHRRQGSARNLLRAAAGWAVANGADSLTVVVTLANEPARALYASLGMKLIGQYHYRHYHDAQI